MSEGTIGRCKYCDHEPIAINARFCRNCGGQKPFEEKPKSQLAGAVIGFTFLTLVLALIAKVIEVIGSLFTRKK